MFAHCFFLKFHSCESCACASIPRTSAQWCWLGHSVCVLWTGAALGARAARGAAGCDALPAVHTAASTDRKWYVCVHVNGMSVCMQMENLCACKWYVCVHENGMSVCIFLDVFPHDCVSKKENEPHMLVRLYLISLSAWVLRR